MSYALSANYRGNKGKGVARKLRDQGKVPAVCYGYGVEGALPIVIDPKELKSGLKSDYGHNTVFSLTVDDGQSHQVMLKDYAEQVITNKLLHVDLLAIDTNKPIKVYVPIKLVGKAPGVVLDGGMLEVKRHELEVECLPKDLPLAIELSLDELHTNQAIHVSDMKMPEGVRAITAEKLTIVSCIAVAQVVEEDAEAAEGEGASEEASAPAEEA